MSYQTLLIEKFEGIGVDLEPAAEEKRYEPAAERGYDLSAGRVTL
jgi:hypothetical protein